MDPWTYAIGVANLAGTPVYAYVGWRLVRRPVPASARLPSAQFSLWWIGLGAVGLIAGVEGLAGGLGVLGFPSALTAYLINVLVAAAALWGLVGYLLYIYTGKYHLLELSAFYAAFYVAVMDYAISSEPYAVVFQGGTPTILYHTAPGGALLVFVAFGLIVPEFVGAILYLSLLRKATDRTRRFRIVMVSASIWLYFGLALVGSPAPLSPAEWNFVRAVADVAAALVSLVAFYPPERLQQWLRVEAVPVGSGSVGGGPW